MINSDQIIFIAGPTASGKSDLAMRLAEHMSGELICADSQTLRRHLDIGTAKPTEADRLRVPHHLLDVIEPYDRFSVAEFQKLARAKVNDIQERGKVPIVVGGSGLYIDALYYNYSIESRDIKEQRMLEDLSIAELKQIIVERNLEMPKNENNPRHLIGSIMRNGKNPEDLQPTHGASIYGILHEDDTLKLRIELRVDRMFDDEFLQEVGDLVAKYGRPPTKMDAIGYPIALRYLDGEIDLEEAKRLFARGDWQYARKQKAWFARNKNIVWLEQSDAFGYITKNFID